MKENIPALLGVIGIIGLVLWSYVRGAKKSRLQAERKAQKETIKDQEARIEAVSENANRSDDDLSDRLSKFEKNTND